MPARRLWLGAALLLAACGGPGRVESPPARAPAPGPVDRAARAAPAASTASFCQALTRIIDAEPQGFAGLRAGRAGERSWAGSLVPPGLQDCRVEGRGNPVASYVCRGSAILGGSPDLLQSSYRQTSAAIDACLAQAVWYPREWRRGDEVILGAGERQTFWTDIMTRPRPAVALKIEEDIGTRGYFVRLAVSTQP